jgi:hypothetical protein
MTLEMCVETRVSLSVKCVLLLDLKQILSGWTRCNKSMTDRPTGGRTDRQAGTVASLCCYVVNSAKSVSAV